MLELMLMISKVQETLCERVLNSTEVLKELKDYDLIVHDSTAFCGTLLGERHNIPRVQLLPLPPNGPFASYHLIPMPISYVPQLLPGFTDKMTFMERLMNLGAYIGIHLFFSIVFNRPMNALKLKYNITPERSYKEAVSNVELLIIIADFALEYPQPLLPGRES